jgi:hypothetical protein
MQLQNKKKISLDTAATTAKTMPTAGWHETCYGNLRKCLIINDLRRRRGAACVSPWYSTSYESQAFIFVSRFCANFGANFFSFFIALF